MRKFVLTLVFVFMFGSVAVSQTKIPTKKDEKPKTVEFAVSDEEAQVLANLVKAINNAQPQLKDVQLRKAEADIWLAQFESLISKYRELFFKNVTDRKLDVTDCTFDEATKKFTCPEKK